MLFLSFKKPVKVGRDLVSCSSPAEEPSEFSFYIWLGAQQKNKGSGRLCLSSVWNGFILHGRKMFLALERCVLVHSSEAGDCYVNRNVSSSWGNYFMLVTLHRLV